MAFIPEKTVKDVVTDFLASAPGLEEIANYRLPEPLHVRAHQLLDKNREGTLTAEERTEMDDFLDIDHLMTLVKAKARLKLA